MFYSHNLLARKGPLGTVWCAAHLQNKLKKSNYITVNIPYTVEQILNPQVPIALRMSGHLLLGVVRIYKKKVEYLQQDYNILRIDISKAYANADINLPEDANQAKFESITLPDNFALDLMDVDDASLLNGSPDNHLRNNADISIPDLSPVSLSRNVHGTPVGYIAIPVGQDASHNPSISGDNQGPGSIHVEEISYPCTPPVTINGVQDSDAGPHLGSNEDDVPSLETVRLNLQKTPPLLPDIVEPDLELQQQILDNTKNNEAPSFSDIQVHARSLSPPIVASPQVLVHTEHDHVIDDLVMDMSAPHVSIELAPSPPPAKRRRIRYDKATVLTNKFMKKALDDPSGLIRKRKGTSSHLDIYRSKNAHKKEKVLFDPVITGMCDDLYQMLVGETVSSKAKLINIEQVEHDDGEVEIPRSVDFVDPFDNHAIPIRSPEQMQWSPPPTTDENTPGDRTGTDTDIWSKSTQAPTTATGVGSTFGTGVGSTVGTGTGSTPGPSSTGSIPSETDTPFPQDQHGFGNPGRLFDIPEADDVDELGFMEDESTPSLIATPEEGSLLPRTRCVAKLIKSKSTATPSSSQNHGSVSIKSIVEGKSRKVCARMFFETLVLKSCDFVDVKQDEHYGDITLKVTPKLSKLQFSN